MEHNYVIVTGGASGLGKALAERWAKAGASVCIADINDTAGQALVASLNELNGSNSSTHFYANCDVTKVKSIQHLKEVAIAKWGRIDLVVNNAGVATADKLEDEPLSQWQWVFDINLFAMVRVSQEFTTVFKKQGRGHFLNVASQAGITPIPYMASYNASKAALVSLSETMRLELADFNIGVSVLCPGFFKTNLGMSLKTKSGAMRKMLDRVFEKAELTADEVADISFERVSRNDFMIVTHPAGQKAYRLKRFLPTNWYLNSVLKQTTKLRQRVSADEQ
ncbi:SDR family oxidoreductase [Thalassotalea euphylliae]|uniref:SDR family oxidoreductase n=1 Tax=Thalassotalea euphylliae TaxID=1655234 RepID=UPI00362DCAAA